MGLSIYLRVYLLRALIGLGSLIDRFFTTPRPLRPAFTITIPAQLSKRKGKISLYFYIPHGQSRPSLMRSAKKDRPLIVNMHGGGFIIGHPTDDSRWATSVVNAIDAVFVSIGYRMGPEHPQPTAVEDCVDALRWLWAHSEEYGFDRSRTITTGFSAGGNLSFTVPLRHARERKVEGGDAAAYDGKLSGIVSFYPSVDRSISREQKMASSAKGKEPEWLHRMIDEAYFRDLPPEGFASLNFSPALAPIEALQDDLPGKIAIFTCEHDKLLVEGENFRKKLRDVGKTVGGNMVANMGHGFDHKGSRHVEERETMYREAIELIKSMT